MTALAERVRLATCGCPACKHRLRPLQEAEAAARVQRFCDVLNGAGYTAEEMQELDAIAEQANVAARIQAYLEQGRR